MKLINTLRNMFPICLVVASLTGCLKQEQLIAQQALELSIQSNYYQCQASYYANRAYQFKQSTYEDFNIDSAFVNYKKALELSNKSINLLEKAKLLDSARYADAYNKRKSGILPGGDEYNKFIQKSIDGLFP